MPEENGSAKKTVAEPDKGAVKRGGKPVRPAKRKARSGFSNLLHMIRQAYSIRKEYYSLLFQLNEQVVTSSRNKEKKPTERASVSQDSIDQLNALDAIKNANYGGIVGFLTVMLLIGAVIVFLVMIFTRTDSTIVSGTLKLSAVSFRSLGPLELGNLSHSRGDVRFSGKAALRGDVGGFTAYARSDSSKLQLSFQEVPDTCRYTLDYLAEGQLSVKCRPAGVKNLFRGSIISYDSILMESDTGEGAAYYYNIEKNPIGFAYMEKDDFEVINQRPIDWSAGPTYVDSLQFRKPINAHLYAFSLESGYVNLLQGKKDTIRLTKLDTVGFEFTEPVRIVLEGGGDGVTLKFQGRVSKLIAGPKVLGSRNNLMPTRFEVLVNRLPDYFLQLILAILGSSLTFLILRQRKAI